MASFKSITTDTSAGLLSPLLRGRIDLDKYRSGLQQCENFLPTIQGPTRFREGFRHMADAPLGNVKLIPFQVGDANRYMILLSAGVLRVYNPSGGLVVTLTNVPYQDGEIDDVRYHTSIDQIIFTHGKYAPHQLNSNVVYVATSLKDSEEIFLLSSGGFHLQASSNNVADPDAWSFGASKFISHPYQESLSDGVQLQLSNEREVVRLTSTNASDFSWSSSVVSSMHTSAGERYVEYNINNQWGFARVLTTTINDQGVKAPENPTGNSCYVDPVDRVINIQDKIIKLCPIYGGTTWANYNIRRNPNGVAEGKLDVRSDTLIWQSDQIGAWVRCSSDNHFDKVCPAGPPDHTGADGLTRWVRVDKLKGLEDHPADYLVGYGQCCYAVAYRAGNTYQMLDWGSLSGTDKGFRWYGSNSDRLASRNLSSEILQNRTSTRFTANSNQQFVNFTNPSDAGNMIIGDLNSNVQFDVAESSRWLTVSENSGIRSLSGTIQLFDSLSDITELATHTVDISSNKTLFETGRDEGRFMMARLSTNWVTVRITTVHSSTSVSCSVLSIIPKEQSGDVYGMEGGGVSTEVRLGAWYTDNWPWTVASYERRQVYGGSNAQPNMVWFSNSTNSTDFRTIERDGLVLDTTGITYPLGSASSVIRWLLSSTSLLIGTEAGEWQIRPNELQSAITSKNIRITEETSVGSINPAARIGSSTFFANSSGRTFSEFIYELQQQRFITKTTTKLVVDLFLDNGIKSFVYQQSPRSIIWVLSEAGELRSLTYRQEDDYYAWATHSTPNGTFAAIGVVPKSTTNHKEDQLFVVVDRAGVRTLETLSEVFTDNETDNFKPNMAFLDSHVRYPTTGYAAQATLPVPAHLAAFATIPTVVDGVYLGSLPVLNGLVVLPEDLTCEKYAMVGVGYEGALQPMPLSFEGPNGAVYGEDIKVSEITLYVYKSVGYGVELGGVLDSVRGNDGDTQFMGQSPKLHTGFMDTHIVQSATFDMDNTPIIRQTEPYPLNLVSFKYKINVTSR